jgi:hypothetical protein
VQAIVGVYILLVLGIGAHFSDKGSQSMEDYFVGRIRLQVFDSSTGYSVDSVEETARRLTELPDDPGLDRKLGESRREHERGQFLITRHAHDDVLLARSLRS